MINIEIKNNYLFVTLSNGLLYSGLINNFEFQQEANNGDSFDVLFKGQMIADGVLFSDFTNGELTFSNKNEFIDFYSVASISSDGLTDAELRANPVQVEVTNQIDLSIIEATLSDVLTSLQNLEVNTDEIEPIIQQTLDEIIGGQSINNTNLLNVISELQGLEANTDEIETKLNSIISNTNGASTLAKQQEIIDLLTFKKNAGSVTKTSLSITTAVQNILTPNANRKKVIFENSGNQRIFICYGQNATTTNFSFSLAQNEKFIEDAPFSGLITATTSAGSSVLQITELN